AARVQRLATTTPVRAPPRAKVQMRAVRPLAAAQPTPEARPARPARAPPRAARPMRGAAGPLARQAATTFAAPYSKSSFESRAARPTIIASTASSAPDAPIARCPAAGFRTV